jgi:hypothetical protein
MIPSLTTVPNRCGMIDISMNMVASFPSDSMLILYPWQILAANCKILSLIQVQMPECKVYAWLIEQQYNNRYINIMGR